MEFTERRLASFLKRSKLGYHGKCRLANYSSKSIKSPQSRTVGLLDEGKLHAEKWLINSYAITGNLFLHEWLVNMAFTG